ncbi:MAG: MarR family transcriptional regulator [Melioribacteraceae bacterium]|nr:MAG: MarR family transcriptional regulator [Melioribacteraceae bacterium]
MNDFRESLGHLIGKGARLLSNRLNQNFASEGINLTKEQYVLLNFLWDNDGLNQRDIADICSKDKTSITRQLEVMEKHNLLVRVPDQNDKRIKRIYLTTMAKELREKAVVVAERTFSEATRDVDESELLICKKVLIKIHENL